MLGMATRNKDNKLKVSYLKRKDINPISILNTMKIVKKKKRRLTSLRTEAQWQIKSSFLRNKADTRATA